MTTTQGTNYGVTKIAELFPSIRKIKNKSLREKVVRRARGERVDGARFERGNSLADTSELNVLKIFERIHLESVKGGLGEHVRIRTDPIDAEPFSF